MLLSELARKELIRSPSGPNGVLGDEIVRCQDDQSVGDRQTHKHAIKGVTVQLREPRQVKSRVLIQR